MRRVQNKMANGLSASKDLMKNYLSELLTEEVPETEDDLNSVQVKEPANKNLETLLNKVSVAPVTISAPLVSNKSLASSITDDITEPVYVESIAKPVQTKQQQKTVIETVKVKEASYRKGSFQAMFFDVAGLLVAVPLIELGGIHNVDKITALIAKPDWYKGVMIHREDKINVVDTALWIMPEKCNEELKNSLNYQYVIMLNNSQWGLMAEKLVDTVTLEHDDVKWSEQGATKRPWLAGLVKNRMCALLDVESLITLLEEGAGINAE